MNLASAASHADSMHEFYVVPFNEPEGHVSWAVQERVYGPDYYRRSLKSFHPTREDAETARVVAYRKVGRYVQR